MTFRDISAKTFPVRVSLLTGQIILNLTGQTKQTQLLLITIFPSNRFFKEMLTFIDKSVTSFPIKASFKYVNEIAIPDVAESTKQKELLFIDRISLQHFF